LSLSNANPIVGVCELAMAPTTLAIANLLELGPECYSEPIADRVRLVVHRAVPHQLSVAGQHSERSGTHGSLSVQPPAAPPNRVAASSKDWFCQ